MSSNERLLAAAYGEGAREEQRLLHSRAGEMEFQYTVRLAQRYMDLPNPLLRSAVQQAVTACILRTNARPISALTCSPPCGALARKIREKG